MSADNTIVILASQGERGRLEYRVAHVQNAEMATDDSHPVWRDTFLFIEFAPCVVHKNRDTAWKEAVRLHDEIGFVEYGIVDINLGRKFGPGESDMFQVAAYRSAQALRPEPKKRRPASSIQRRINSLTRRVHELRWQLATVRRTLAEVRQEKASVLAEMEKVLAAHR